MKGRAAKPGRAAERDNLPPAPRDNPHLFGHHAAEARFARALAAGRLPHAWMLVGPRGVGKATLAFRLARSLLGHGSDPGGDRNDPAHPIFRMVASGAHIDLHVLQREHDKGRLRTEIVVDQAREMIERLRATSGTGGHRVLVIDPADELNRNAANALLKLIEEPPPRAVLILVVQRPGAIPRTIASRCAMLRLRPLGEDDLQAGVAALLPSCLPEQVLRVVPLAGGSLGRALELLASGWLDTYGRLLALLAEGGEAARLEAAELLVPEGREERLEQAASPLRAALRRAARLQAGAPLGGEILDGEADLLGRMGRGLGLDRLLAVWETRWR